MRYIGNKTKLLPFIAEGLNQLDIRGRTACDPFAGTTAVAQFLKNRGFAVTCGDIMSFSHVLQWAYVVVDQDPTFSGLKDMMALDPDPLGAAIRYLNALEPQREFIFSQFSPEGSEGAEHDRRYFTPENAAKIDSARRQIWEWRAEDRLSPEEGFVLLAALLEAADRVANTTGVYAAYVKSWQPNAERPLELRRPQLTTNTGLQCFANRRDALGLIRDQPKCDLLYLDPPYNARQYAGYYHIPEIIAEGWFDRVPKLRGKTGLADDANKRSDWSRRRQCQIAFEELVATSRCRHILMSYNSEGIIPEECIERVLRENGISDTYRRLEQPYKRYRSDRDSKNRRYKGDKVTERLYYVRRF